MRILLVNNPRRTIRFLSEDYDIIEVDFFTMFIQDVCFFFKFRACFGEKRV